MLTKVNGAKCHHGSITSTGWNVIIRSMIIISFYGELGGGGGR